MPYYMKFIYDNFYSIAGDFDQNKIYHGIHEFKKGFNGNVVKYIGEFIFTIGFTYKVCSTIKNIKHT